MRVDNVYPYDRNGRLPHDVRLYDSYGTPFDFGRQAGDPNRRTVVDATGATLFNTLPVRCFEPGTNHVADPDAAPLAVRRLTTPPLDP